MADPRLVRIKKQQKQTNKDMRVHVTDLVVVFWVGAVAVTIQQGILSPYLSVTAVARTDPT